MFSSPYRPRQSFGCVSAVAKHSPVSVFLCVLLSVELPIELTSPVLHYDNITDVNLGRAPYVSFECLYKYLCHDSTSLKAMDRAVKHAESGDVFSLAMCEVCKNYCCTIVNCVKISHSV